MSDIVEGELIALGSAWRRAIPTPLRLRVNGLARRASDAGPTTEEAPREWSVHRSPVMAAVAVSAVVVLLVAIPGARLSIARQGFRVLQALRIAPHTQLQTDDAQTPEEVNASVRQSERQVGAGRMWHVETAYIGFGGSVPPATSPDVRRVEDPELLASLTPLTLVGLDGEYRGHPIAFHHALLAPGGVVLTFFGRGYTELLLVQAPVAGGQQVAYSRSVSGPGGTVTGVAPSIATFTVSGQQLTWDPDTTGIMPNSSALRWEANRVSYSLYGRALTRDEALALFSGLRPPH